MVLESSQTSTATETPTNNMSARVAEKRTLDQEPTEEVEIKKEKIEDEDDSSGTYRELAAKRRQMHLSFLNVLGVNSVLEDLPSFTPPPKPKAIPKPKRPILRNIVEGPLRRSSRLQNKPPSEKIEDFSASYQIEAKPRRKKIRGVVSFSVAAQSSGDQFPDSFVQELQFLGDEKPIKLGSSVPLSQYENKFKTMRINDSLVAKLAYSRIYSISVHPTATKILFATGSRDGEVSFWDVENRKKTMPLLFVPHSERVSCLHFSPYNMCEVYTCSYDGTMRCGNLTEGVFTEVFQANPDDDEDDGNDIMCTSFDFQTPSTFLVSLWHGSVTLVDKRTKNIQGEKDYRTHECVAKTVSVHPTKSDYFAVAGGNGVASVWDLRGTKKKPVCELKHGKSLNSAYFSPVTGNYVLTTSMDDRLSVFDCSSLTDAKLKKAISHNNHTGRWLAPLRAVWLPKCEEGFLVGCMEQPRRIQIFNINGQLSHTFLGDSLSSVCSVNTMHPSRSALAGANSSGKIHVFLGKEDK